jgi:Ca2+-binding RTX toxin-like protein
VLFDHGGNDTLQLNGIAAADVTLARQGDDLVLSVKGSADKITVYSHFANENYAIDAVRFADSVVWDKSDISNAINGGGQVIQGTDGDEVIQGTNGDDTLSGGAGNDKLYGEAGADTLSGGKGNDTLEGGAGNDTYQFSRGDGQDTILDRDEKAGNKDTLQFVEGIAPQDVLVTRSNDDLVLSIEGSADQIVVKNHFSSENYAIEEIQFANGEVWDKAYIDDAVDDGSGPGPIGGVEPDPVDPVAPVDPVVPVDPAEPADPVKPAEPADPVKPVEPADPVGQVIQGTPEEDTLQGGAGNDTLDGKESDDTLHGGAGNDVLKGGKGNDRLEGGAGNDIYLFSRGDGQDTIFDRDATPGNTDIIRFGEGITVGDLEATFVTNGDLILSLKGSDDQITVQNYFLSGEFGVEAIQFADGATWYLPQWEDYVEIVGAILDLPELSS